MFIDPPTQDPTVLRPSLSVVVNNDVKPAAGGAMQPPKLPPNVVAFEQPKKPRKPRKKSLTPKQRFRRDVAELGELSDHLYAAADAMSNVELNAFRARLTLIMEAVKSLKADTEEFVTTEDDTDG